MKIPAKQLDVSGLPGDVPTTANRGMPGLLTALDGDLACATAITTTPSHGGAVTVFVNGAEAHLTGDLLGDCYFSGDGGVTPRAMNAVVAADKLYWRGSTAGYQIAVTDLIDFIYDVTQ
jgi:hypothetical protein